MPAKPPIVVGDDNKTPIFAQQLPSGNWALPMTSEDGAHATIGSKADAPVTNPALSASEIALLKGILKQLQGTGSGSAPADVIDRANRILGKVTAEDGAIAALGALAAAAITDPSQSASVIALLKGILKQLQGQGSGALPINLMGSNVRENPFETAIGQDVMSVSEGFWARLFREGRPRMTLIQGGAAGAPGVLYLTATLNVSPGCVFYPRRACVSCDQDAQLIVQIVTNIADVNGNATGSYYELVFAKAGTPLVVTFDGETRCYEGGSVAIGVIPTQSGAKVYGSIYGIEVTANA